MKQIDIIERGRYRYLGTDIMGKLCHIPDCSCRLINLRDYITEDIDSEILSIADDVYTNLVNTLMPTTTDGNIQQELDKWNE